LFPRSIISISDDGIKAPINVEKEKFFEHLFVKNLARGSNDFVPCRTKHIKLSSSLCLIYVYLIYVCSKTFDSHSIRSTVTPPSRTRYCLGKRVLWPICRRSPLTPSSRVACLNRSRIPPSDIEIKRLGKQPGYI